MEKKNWMKELFRPENKKARVNLFTAFIIGILLLFMSNLFFIPPEKEEIEEVPQQQIQTEQQKNTIEEEMEKRLENIFAKMEGVGQVEVMVTMKNTTEGIVIVAEGGENPQVAQLLSEASQALLNVPAHKVAVLKMK